MHIFSGKLFFEDKKFLLLGRYCKPPFLLIMFGPSLFVDPRPAHQRTPPIPFPGPNPLHSVSF